MGGTARRMRDFANFIMKELGYKLSSGSELEDLTARGHRYSMYKVGCVLCVSVSTNFYISHQNNFE